MKRALRLPAAEPLEGRIAPAATFSFTDTDGMMVTVTSSKGTDADLAQVCKLAAEGLGSELQEIRLSELATVFAGTNLTVLKGTADDANVVNVGYVNAVGLSIGTVTIDGDLGQIDAGKTTPGIVNDTPVVIGSGTAVKSLKVGSIGTQGLNTQAAGGSLDSVILGALGSLTVAGDYKDATLTVYGAFPDVDTEVSDRFDARGKIGDIFIGGNFLGGATAKSGSIYARGEIGDLKIVGDLRGGQGDDSGSIISEREMGKVDIGGDVRGGILTGPGTSDRAGRVFSGGFMGSVKIGGDLVGGDGTQSGNVSSAFGLGALTIGGIVGGAGELSGAVGTGGNIGKITVTGDIVGMAGKNSAAIVSGGGITSVRVEGDLKGGGGYQSGAIGSFKPIGAVTITGDIMGGSEELSGVVVSATTIKSVTVFGSIKGGGGLESGAVGTGGVLGPVTVGVNIEGGNGQRSGAVIGGTNATKVTVNGNVIGGNGPESGTIYSNGDLGIITVIGDVHGGPISVGDDAGSINANGKIKSVIIRGDLIGSAGDGSGTVQSTEGIGTVSIGQNIEGGDGDFSGGIISAGKIARVMVGGSVMGGDGMSSGVIETDGDGEFGDMGAISIGGQLQGGNGPDSGIVFSSGRLASFTIQGSIFGGFGVGSAVVSSDLDMGAVNIGGDVRGAATESGKIFSAGKLASITIGGSLMNSDGRYDTNAAFGGGVGQIYSADAMGAVKINGSVIASGPFGGHIRGASIKSVSIVGDLTGGGDGTASIVAEEGDLGPVTIGGAFNAATSIDEGSRISAQGKIASVTIGDLVGTTDGRGYITAGESIGKITVTNSTAYFRILAGYDVDLQPITAAASIGPVTIGTTGAGDWQATDLVAGAITGFSINPSGGDGFFGTEDDTVFASPTGAISKIGAVIIKGAVNNSDFSSAHYGIVATKIASVKIGGLALPLTAGLDVIDVGGTGVTTDLTVREVSPSGGP